MGQGRGQEKPGNFRGKIKCERLFNLEKTILY